MTKVRLTRTHQNAPRITQSRVKRDWMDQTYNKHAYQCLPMTMANVYGWEIILDEDLVVQWNGGNTVPEVISGGTQNDRQVAYPSIIGIMSIGMGWIVNTEPGYSTWFTGSPNYFIDGAVPLTATVPSSWWPDEVQMNWKITKVGEPVIFPAGTPFCFFNIYKDETIKDVEFEVQNIWDDEELMKSRIAYGELKSKTTTEQPWTWVRGIKTGIDAAGTRIGPTYNGLPSLQSPAYNINEPFQMNEGYHDEV